MADKTQMKKLKDQEVTGLRGKLVEVRKIGAEPFYIKVTNTDTIKKALKKADIPDSSDVKIEGVKSGATAWIKVELAHKAHIYDKLAITTKVSGA